MKSRDHYIYLTAVSLECYRDTSSGLELVAAISIPRTLSIDMGTIDQSLRRFEAHLDLYPHDRYFVVTDTQAEAYQAETIPTLSRRDLRLLLNRKLEQRYRTTDYRAVVPHRKRPHAFIRNLTRRRSRTTTRILYALIGSETLAPWLEALERRDLDVRGLYSLGALMPALLSRVKIPAHTDVLFVIRTVAGYRHAFVAPAGLRFSRLCAYSNAGDAQVGQEIDKTLQYLTMTRLWGVQGRDRKLNITVIDARPAPIAFTVPGNNVGSAELVQLHPRELDPNGPAALLDATNSAWLLLNRAALSEHGAGCASNLSLLDGGRRAHYRRTALCATAAAAALSAGYLAFTEFAIRENVAAATTAELVARHVNSQAESGEGVEPKTALEPEQLRAVVRTRDRLMARSINAFGLLQRTAAALAPFPDLAIDRLEWSYADAAQSGTPPAAGESPPNDAAPPASNTILLQIGGHVGGKPLKSDANAAVAGLGTALARELQGRQHIEKWPFDVAPGGTLVGKPHDTEGAQAEFSLTVAVSPDLHHAS